MPTPAAQLDHADQLLSELERVENHLNDVQRQLTRSHRLVTLGTVAATIAHEFNNILTPMLSYCQLAEADPEDIDLLRKAVAKAHQGAIRCAQISSAMLGFARDEQTTGPANIRQAIDDVFNCLAREPARDGIELKLAVPHDLAAAIPPISLQQILLNLVLNARQAMRNAGGTLTITARLDESTDRITLSVADTGPGIPPEIADRLFEPFITQRPPDQPAGTGLGLAICRELTERAGGSIAVQSEPGHGARFVLELGKG